MLTSFYSSMIVGADLNILYGILSGFTMIQNIRGTALHVFSSSSPSESFVSEHSVFLFGVAVS